MSTINTNSVPSQIPVLANKRSSIQMTSPGLPASTSASTGGSNSRSSSPLLSKIPMATARSNPNGASIPTRRMSVLGAGRKSLNEANGAEPIAENPLDSVTQIETLKSSLEQAHQRIMEMSKEMRANNMTLSVSPGGGSTVTEDGRPWTPVNGLVGLQDFDGFTPGSVLAAGDLDFDDEEAEENAGTDPLRQPTQSTMNKTRNKILPHSSPSYDLRRRAGTPSDGTPFRPGDGRLGLSQIPVSKVQHALSLHGTPPPATSPRPSLQALNSSPLSTTKPDTPLRSPFLGQNLSPPPPSGGATNGLGLGQIDGRLSPGLSPGMRRSTGPVNGSAASSRVIDTLQTDLLGVKGHLERVKGEVRSSQRVIEALTRQNEDLKETRERTRVECEGLNNVIARKERLLQEVLERARKAEASLTEVQATRKHLEQSTKKSLSTMTTQLTEAQHNQARAEREAGSLRDSVKSLRDAWAREVKNVRDEWRLGREEGERQREEARNKHVALVKLVQAQSADRATIQTLVDTSKSQSAAATKAFEDQIKTMRDQVDQSAEESKQAKAIASDLAAELVRLRRMMREPPREDLSAAAADSFNGAPS